MNFKALCTCFISLAISSSAIGMEIERSSLMASKRLGDIRLFHKDNNRFVVEHDGQEKGIQPYLVSPTLRSMSRDHLKGFLHNGYIQLRELRDEKGNIDYKLDAYGRLKGGGPVSGFVAYWTTKAVCYGSAATAMALPAVAHAVHRRATEARLGSATTTGLVLGATSATVVISSPTIIAGGVVAVESTATSVGAFFALLPFLP